MADEAVGEGEGGVSAWQPNSYLVAGPEGPMKKTGYTYRGLGLHMAIGPSPKGRRPATWSLDHLGSGLRVCLVTGTIETAFPIATEIAEAGDWSFDGPTGYINQFPDARERVAQIIAAHANKARWGNGQRMDPARREAVARQIAMARP